MAVSPAPPAWIAALRESEEVNQLVYALSLAERFYFASAVCGSPEVADALCEALADRVSEERGAEVRMARLDPYQGYDRPEQPIPFERVVDRVLARLVSPLPEDLSPEVVLVVDASRALPHDYAWGTMFQRMNERRNTISKALAGPLLFCVPPWLEKEFARNAPDFWSICSLAVVVKGAPPAKQARGRRGGLEAMSGANRPGASGLLSAEALREIHTAAINLGLDRGMLVAGLDPSFLATIPRSASAVAQLLLDLHRMNEVERLANGAVPLQRWLENAERLAGSHSEADVFRRLLEAIAEKPRSAPAHPRVSIARLPSTSKDLFGRDAELAWLDKCWSEGVNVASIVAWGGVGKSALVNRWLAGMRDRGWNGATRVYGWSFYSQGMDRLASSDQFVDAALRWFGDAEPTQGSPWDKGERLAELVRKERTILVLDGVEPLQWGHDGRFKDPALQALLKELGWQNNGLCIVTTRIGLTDLDGLHGAKVQTKNLDKMSPEAGAKLLEARGASGTDAELREASEEYKGHGLALTLLGSYLGQVAGGDIRRRDEIGPLLVEEQKGGHARRVMEAYKAWLGKPEVSILHMLGLFDRPVEADEIAALRADPAVPGLTDGLAGIDGRVWSKSVAGLRKIGLLSEEQDRRLDAHPLVREYFGEQLRREQPEAWREGHRRLYEHLRRKAKELPETIEEMGPLYAAVVHGCLAGRNQEVLHEVFRRRIERGDEHFDTYNLGAYSSAAAALSAFFSPPWERLVPGLNDADQGFVLHSAGIVLQSMGRLPEATGLLRLSLELVIAAQDWENAAIGAANLSELLKTRGQLSDAVAQARKGVDFADKSGDAHQRSGRRAMLGTVWHVMGLRDEAAVQFEEAERLQKESDPEVPVLYGVRGFWYCDLLLDRGREAEVRERAARSMRITESNRWLLDIALDHVSLGRAHLLAAQRGAAGDLAQAASHLTQAVDGLRRAGDQTMLPLGLLARAALHIHTRAFAAARHDLDEALTLATRCGFRLHEADAHLDLARLALAESDPAAAREHLTRARELIDETGYHRRDGEVAELAVALAR